METIVNNSDTVELSDSDVVGQNGLQISQNHSVSAINVFAFNSLLEAKDMAKITANSGLCPKDYVGKPANILVAWQMGAELGLKPMQALQNIAVINGKPSIYGDAMLAMALAYPGCEDVIEDDIPTIRKNGKAVCIVKRRGKSDVIRTFGVEDAKKAGLWGKSGPWTTYPEIMMQNRAKGFALRHSFPQLYKGLVSAEEARDYDVVQKGNNLQVLPARKTHYVKAVIKDINPNKTEEVKGSPEIPNPEEVLTLREQLDTLIEIKNLPEETLSKWLNAAKVKTIEDFTDEQVRKCIERLKSM